MKNKNVLIFGVTGQDGSYLAYLLIKSGYKIYGISKNKNTENLKKLNIEKQVILIKFNYIDYFKIPLLIKKINCSLIFFLAGETSVKKSEIAPYQSIVSNTKACAHVLEYMRTSKKKIKFLNASSGEIFGGSKTHKKFNENSTYFPRSFYALSKIISLEVIKSYRKQFGLWACNAILFNHESSLRAKGFVIKKIIDFVKNVKNKKKNKKLQIGNINIIRDWGWAPEYSNALINIINYKVPKDFVIATGRGYKLRYVIEKVFSHYNLDYKKFIKINKNFYRKNEVQISIGNPYKANKLLYWKSKKNINQILKNIIEEKLF
jgi:GDPmannose 4,6-dehydratase